MYSTERNCAGFVINGTPSHDTTGSTAGSLEVSGLGDEVGQEQTGEAQLRNTKIGTRHSRLGRPQ